MIRGQKKPLESASKVNVDINTSIHNRFDIEVIDSRTGKVRQRAQAENIILDQLWTRLLTPASYFEYIQYGSGTTIPNHSDVSLTKCEGTLTISDTKYGIDAQNQVAFCRRKAQMLESVAVGVSISEIGIAYNYNSSDLTKNTYLCTKALLKDMNNNALTIEKTNTDIINVYATVFVHWNDSKSFTFNTATDNSGDYFLTRYLTGIQVNLSSEAEGYGHGSYYVNDTGKGTIPDLFRVKSPKGLYTPDSTQKLSSAKATFDINNKCLCITGKRLGVNDFNLYGGIAAIELMLRGCYYRSTASYGYIAQDKAITLNVGDNTWYPGSTITGEAVGTGDGSTVDFTTKFRIHKDCAIKVNGTSINNASIDVDKDIADGSYNIHFDTPPAEGDVITADYFTDVIAKDENHVFDFSITFHFGEKVS